MTAAWFSQWAWIPPYVIFALVLLLFPTGKLLSPRWRLLAAILLAWGLLMVMLLGFSPLMIAGPLGSDLALPNPIGLWDLTGQQTEMICGFLWPMLFLLIALSAISIALRWRRTGGVERQQIKYFLYAVVLIVSVIIIGQFIPGRWFNIINNLAFLMLPVAFGLAILRYHLYDIDVVIRKTLVYSVLTGLLTLVYFSSVILLQQLFAGITSEQPTIVVLSTLLIAALFTPLRRWVQNVIDLRFFRQRYDAQRVLASFSQTVRNETDPEQLTAELVRVVQETMQPATVAVWLAPGSRHSGRLE
jgi:hypothetical protein